MNSIKVIMMHKTFEKYNFELFNFVYQNITISLEMEQGRLIITLVGKKSTEKILEQFWNIYDLLFLILGGFPKREQVLVNDIEIDTSEWVRKFDTALHHIEGEARLCEISSKTINADILNKMVNVHQQTLSSVEYIVCEYYSHMVSNHRIELMTHTIEGFFRHTAYYNQLFQKLKNSNSKKQKVTYFEIIERFFNVFFIYHRKYNAEILSCMHVKSKKEFYEIITDTRNDFSHFLEQKQHRLIKGKDMVYFIDIIFFAERLFVLKEVLEIEISDEQVQEYLYILHDWIDELVNNREDRVKSKRYINIVNAKEWNRFLENFQIKE